MAATANAREVIGEATLGELEGTLRGRLVRPSDPDYDQARLVWNAAHDRRPALIIRCAGTADVMRRWNSRAAKGSSRPSAAARTASPDSPPATAGWSSTSRRTAVRCTQTPDPLPRSAGGPSSCSIPCRPSRRRRPGRGRSYLRRRWRGSVPSLSCRRRLSDCTAGDVSHTACSPLSRHQARVSEPHGESGTAPAAGCRTPKSRPIVAGLPGGGGIPHASTAVAMAIRRHRCKSPQEQ